MARPSSASKSQSMDSAGESHVRGKVPDYLVKRKLELAEEQQKKQDATKKMMSQKV